MIIPPTWNLPESIRSRLGGTTYGRQRTIAEEGHILVILHRPPGADDSKREGALYWREPSGEWKASRGNNGTHALNAHIQAYIDLETQLQKRYDEANDTIALHDLLATLTPLARAAHNMHGALQDAREELKGDGFIIEARDKAYEVDRNLDILLEDTRNELQFRTAREAEEQNRLAKEALRASHRLNVLAALFLPLTALASVFGMNLMHGLDQNSVAIFWSVTVAAVVLGVGFKAWMLGGDDSDSTPPTSNLSGPSKK
jgi:hypothetical protein